MDNPVVWISGMFIVLAVTNLLTFLATRAHAAKDRADRRTDEQERERRASLIRAIHDTRDRMLALVALVETVANGDGAKGLERAQAYSTDQYPSAWNELTADDELIYVLATTIPEIIERGWGNSNTYEWAERMGHIHKVVRDAWRRQEERVIETGSPLFSTAEQAAAVNASKQRLFDAIARQQGGLKQVMEAMQKDAGA